MTLVVEAQEAPGLQGLLKGVFLPGPRSGVGRLSAVSAGGQSHTHCEEPDASASGLGEAHSPEWPLQKRKLKVETPDFLQAPFQSGDASVYG